MLQPIQLNPIGVQSVGSGLGSVSLGTVSPLGTKTSTFSKLGGIGGIAGSLSALGNIKSDPLGAVTSALAPIPGVGDIAKTVSAIGSKLGIGPEDWAKVQARFEGYAQKYHAYFTNAFNNVKTFEDLSNLDRYLEICRLNEQYLISIYKSSNSKNGHRILLKALTNLQNQLRQSIKQAYSKTANIATKSESINYKTLGLRSPIDYTFKPRGTATYLVLTAKPQAQQQGKPLNSNTNFNGNASSNSNTNEKGSSSTLIIIGVLILFRKQLAKMFGIKL